MKHFITQTDVSRTTHQELLLAQAASMSALWSRTSWLKEVWEIVLTVEAWRGVTIAANRTGLCITLRGVTLGHVRWDGRINLPFAPKVLDQLMVEWMAVGDPDQPESDGVLFDLRATADVDRAVWLLRLAYLMGDSKVNVCAG